MKTNEKLYDAIFGLALADALGVPYEFKRRDEFHCTGMTGYGTHFQPAGTWSDDTSMTIATCKSLKDNGGRVNTEDIRSNFIKWYRNGAFTADGTVFDIGMTVESALRTGRPGAGEGDNGNGSLMRILPLAFTDCTDDEIRAVSAITHAHRISKEACVIYVYVARRLLAGEPLGGIIPTLRYEKPFDRLWHIDEIGRDEIESSGFVLHSLEAALWAVSRNETYRAAVLEAVNLGRDTDTTAAIAGGLAGIAYGLKDCEDWMETLRNRELIRECLWNIE